MGVAQSAMQANPAIDRHRGCSGCTLCMLLRCQHELLDLNPAHDGHTLVFLVLLQIFLCETEFFALANMQVDLVSDVRDYGGALENVSFLQHRT